MECTTCHWGDMWGNTTFSFCLCDLKCSPASLSECLECVWAGRAYRSSNSVSPPNIAPRNTPSGCKASLICTRTPGRSFTQCKPRQETIASWELRGIASSNLSSSAFTRLTSTGKNKLSLRQEQAESLTYPRNLHPDHGAIAFLVIGRLARFIPVGVTAYHWSPTL